ncbi:MAG: hypothetical protein WCH62_08850, partial [Candidatus Omnitrophota bacterium]
IALYVLRQLLKVVVLHLPVGGGWKIKMAQDYKFDENVPEDKYYKQGIENFKIGNVDAKMSYFTSIGWTKEVGGIISQVTKKAQDAMCFVCAQKSNGQTIALGLVADGYRQNTTAHQLVKDAGRLLQKASRRRLIDVIKGRGVNSSQFDRAVFERYLKLSARSVRQRKSSAVVAVVMITEKKVYQAHAGDAAVAVLSTQGQGQWTLAHDIHNTGEVKRLESSSVESEGSDNYFKRQRLPWYQYLINVKIKGQRMIVPGLPHSRFWGGKKLKKTYPGIDFDTCEIKEFPISDVAALEIMSDGAFNIWPGKEHDVFIMNNHLFHEAMLRQLQDAAAIASKVLENNQGLFDCGKFKEFDDLSLLVIHFDHSKNQTVPVREAVAKDRSSVSTPRIRGSVSVPTVVSLGLLGTTLSLLAAPAHVQEISKAQVIPWQILQTFQINSTVQLVLVSILLALAVVAVVYTSVGVWKHSLKKILLGGLVSSVAVAVALQFIVWIRPISGLEAFLGIILAANILIAAGYLVKFLWKKAVLKSTFAATLLMAITVINGIWLNWTKPAAARLSVLVPAVVPAFRPAAAPPVAAPVAILRQTPNYGQPYGTNDELTLWFLKEHIPLDVGIPDNFKRFVTQKTHRARTPDVVRTFLNKNYT